jgi:hypothetical protein
MATVLNMTMPLKQDDESKKRLQELKTNFSHGIQQKINAALMKSRIVHYARLVVIDDKYIQVLTEFDGDRLEYTEFFRKELPDVFRAVFSLVEGVPSWEELNNPNSFFEHARRFNVRSLGASVDGEESEGYLFCAYGDATVREIQDKLGRTSGGP